MSGNKIGPSGQDSRRRVSDGDKHPKDPLAGRETELNKGLTSFPPEVGLPTKGDSNDSARANQSVREEPSSGRSLSAGTDPKPADEYAERDADETTVEPRLRVYFGPDAVQVAAFVKALKKAKVRKFDPDDIAIAEVAIADNDKEGSRLWQLVVHASSLGPISTWGWPFIQNRVNTLVGAQVDLSQESPSRILGSIITAISGAFLGENRQYAKRAENDLRLSIAWLLERRNADVTDVAAQVHRLFVGAEGDVEGRVRKAVSTGSKAELQATIAALHLINDQIRAARHERDVERRERSDLKSALDGLREKVARDTELIRRLEGERAELEQQLYEERTRAESDRRHHAHSSSQRQAEVGTSLQRVKGLVVEAGEAVQIAMKRADEGSLRGLQAAERRIVSAIDAITGIGK
ncbi:hypothetical protein EN933_00140 [Mesorhizobium sp. M7A.F.Ca.US.001.01.1.1]|nr:hypothetical protein EN933_00140 [Mesorhizobium sp. M7A.F.Ca.US.001.01.1.1]